MTDHLASIESHFRRSREAMERVANDNGFLSDVAAIASRCIQALRSGNKIMFAGNGGSASDAQHIAAELIGRYKRDRDALPAIALTTDTSALTAISNDYGFEHVFARQLRGLGRNGDVFVGLTTSGRSPNIVAALKAARETGVVPIGFTGSAVASMTALCDLTLIAPSNETALIQQIHITAGHAICDSIERDLFGPHT